ncbi:hypothetical protein [Phormidium tenue]|uniref:Uncharacterized protein n=1 Tax=Phormidium tenue FACHB-1050 TaxID=2692857 RepID=A0ABR8CI48_9CYAN|nr:hypothetical protein [Phormidium tenue]MBD2319625.1 hypothetical protein [Phormidium tenue FACHB-1050]
MFTTPKTVVSYYNHIGCFSYYGFLDINQPAIAYPSHKQRSPIHKKLK